MYCGIGKYELPMYCLYIILNAGITHLIILLRPGLEPRFCAFSCCKPTPSLIQAHRWVGLGQALGFVCHHYNKRVSITSKVFLTLCGVHVSVSKSLA